MKTTAMAHQTDALAWLEGRDYGALGMEQGTGKTWTLLADTEERFRVNDIDALFVLAPRGVHTNWVLREIPTHLEVDHVAMAYSSGMGVRAKAALERVFEVNRLRRQLRILAMNYDALLTKDGFAAAKRFLRTGSTAMALDESQRIKTLSSARTVRALALRPHARLARISSGTLVSNTPTDVFSQFEFMQSGLLGTTSFRAFTAEYCALVSPDSPMLKKLIDRNPRMVRAQIVQRDESGEPIYRNLDKLNRLVSKHMFRVLKKDCLDLPEKIYTARHFDLSPKQRAAYNLMEQEYRVQLDSGELEVVARLGSLMRLQQITSGFLPTREGRLYFEDNHVSARMVAFLDAIEDLSGKMIIWARFVEELEQIASTLRKLHGPAAVVEYRGETTPAKREVAVNSFQDRASPVRFFVGQAQAGGVGLTLTAAETVVYYSNDYSLETRKQSEDRAHRIGTRTNVLYVDLIATGTIDADITLALQRKESIAAMIMGDTKVARRQRTPDNPFSPEPTQFASGEDN